MTWRIVFQGDGRSILTCFTSRGRRSTSGLFRWTFLGPSWISWPSNIGTSGGAISLHPDVGKTNYGCSTHVHQSPHTLGWNICSCGPADVKESWCEKDTFFAIFKLRCEWKKHVPQGHTQQADWIPPTRIKSIVDVATPKDATQIEVQWQKRPTWIAKFRRSWSNSSLTVVSSFTAQITESSRR